MLNLIFVIVSAILNLVFVAYLAKEEIIATGKKLSANLSEIKTFAVSEFKKNYHTLSVAFALIVGSFVGAHIFADMLYNDVNLAHACYAGFVSATVMGGMSLFILLLADEVKGIQAEEVIHHYQWLPETKDFRKKITEAAASAKGFSRMRDARGRFVKVA